MKYLSSLLLIILVTTSCWKNKSPENLPRLKAAFKSQVETFEKKKSKTNDKVNKGMESLNALSEALQNAKNEDKEFAKVYRHWEKVDKRVKTLNREYEDLKAKAENLFAAMEKQTNSLSDVKSKSELLHAIGVARKKYSGTLATTSIAIQKLRSLHSDAVDVIKALEVAVALNSFDDINAQLKSIEGRVGGIMDDLNKTVIESKKLYEKKLDQLN